MSNVVGSLRINLSAGTAEFVNNLDGASRKAGQTANDIKGSFDKVNFAEARGGVMLLGEEIGVHLPRHVNSFLATLPGVGVAMSAAFPVLAVVMLGMKVFEAAEHVAHLQDKIKAASDAYTESALATMHHAEATELDNLRLQDQLRILNGDLPKNGLKAALKEARIEAEELTAQIQKAIVAEKKLLEDQSVGTWKGLLGATQTDDIVKFVVDGKAAIAELERQKGIALTAHQDAVVKSLQLEIDAKNLALRTELTTRAAAEEEARKEEITKDFDAAILRATNDSKAREAEHRNTPKQQDIANKQMGQAMDADAAKINAAAATRAGLYKTAVLELQAEDREQKDLLENAKLHLAITEKQVAASKVVDMPKRKDVIPRQSSFDGNGKFIDAEETKRRAMAALDLQAAADLDKAHLFDLSVLQKDTDEQMKQQKLTDDLVALVHTAALMQAEHNIKLLEASGIITKLQADKRLAALYQKDETDQLTKENAELAKKKATLDILAAKTNNGRSGSDDGKESYKRALKDYQEFLIAKEKMNAASAAKRNKVEEDEAARQHAIQMVVVQSITSTLNSGVQSWVSGQESFGQAAGDVWKNFASTAVMAIIKMGEQELIGLALHQSIADREKITSAKGAFHKTYDQLSGIPIIGPVIAPIGAAAAFAAVMAFKKGGVTPGDENSMFPAMLHGKEMVLPAPVAKTVTDAMSRGGSDGGSSNGKDQHLHYSPVVQVPIGGDAKQIEKFMDSHFDRYARSQARKRGIRY
jgi:hypothetical protein